ncbi:hypothetical protein [Solwaraspora sp. WMMA2101]|uniref:hypothetical protein n=1 Tax=Solwaraspora sp. WMMA2101 TaxID=3404124 RepID=UPI003B947AD0
MKRENSKDGVITTGVMLLLGACLLPEIVIEGSWRAWGAVPTGILVLFLFIREVTVLVRERRRPPPAD